MTIYLNRFFILILACSIFFISCSPSLSDEDVPVKLESFSVSENVLRIPLNGSLDISGNISLSDGGAFTYQSADDTIVVVDETGLATRLALGNVIITITSVAQPTLTATLSVITASFSLEKNEINLWLDRSVDLSEYLILSDINAPVIQYSSSDEETISVDEKGLVTRLKAGAADIMVTNLDDSSDSEVVRVKDGAFTLLLEKAPFSARSHHQAFVFDGKIFVLGGRTGEKSVTNTVWSSSDGVNWGQESTKGLKWSARSAFSAIVFDDKIWLTGGDTGSDYCADSVDSSLWSSENGVDWNEEVSAAPFGDRTCSLVGSLGDQLWFYGGLSTQGGTPTINDVWSSYDGSSNWLRRLNSYQSKPVAYAVGIQFNEKLWSIGGSLFGPIAPIYTTSNGVNWSTETQPFAGVRLGMGATVYQDELWVMSGNSDYNDVWSLNVDGVWHQESSNAGFTGREGMQVVTFDDGSGEKMYLIGGQSGDTYYNDVWVVEP